MFKTGSVLIASCLSLATTAIVEGAEPAASGDSAAADSSVEEIIVTARRKSETLVEVPITINAIAGSDLAKQAVFQINDLQTQVPGFTGSANNGGTTRYSIRGQGEPQYGSVTPAVTIYTNDVPTQIGASRFYDIESVQVLKGPQGTLFGKETTGGAVLINTAKPGFSSGGYGLVRFGNYDWFEFEGATNLPLNDKLAVRLATDIVRRDGYVHLTSVASSPDLGNLDTDALRASVLFQPIDAFTNTTVFSFEQIKNTGPINVLINHNPCQPTVDISTPACALSPTNVGQYNAGAAFGLPFPFIPSYAQIRAQNPNYPAGGYESLPTDPFSSTAPPGRVENHNSNLTNTTQLQATDTITIKNIAAYTRAALVGPQSLDFDGTVFVAADVVTYGRPTSYWSDELQLQGKSFGNTLDWIVGGFIDRSSSPHGTAVAYYRPYYYQTLQAVFGPAIPYPFTSSTSSANQSRAVFAQGTYSFTGILNGLNLSAGVRRTSEKRSTHDLTNPSSSVVESTFDGTSYLVGLGYQPTERANLYVTYRDSFRPGGFSALSGLSGGAANLPFSSEKIRDTEVGFKYAGRVAGMVTHSAISAYYDKIDNTQLPYSVGASSTTLNAPNGSTVKGIELQETLDVTEWLQFGVNYSHLKAQFNTPAVLINPQTMAAIDLGQYADAPENTLNVSIQLKIPVSAATGPLTLRGDAYHQDAYQDNLFSTPGNPLPAVPAYTLANFRATLDDVGAKGVSVSAFVKNAFNKTYFVAYNTDLGTTGEPRMFGAELRYGF